MKELAYLLFETPGTRVDPKGDGRVEIPRSMAFLMGWNRKKMINVFARMGSLYISSGAGCGEGRDAQLIGQVAVSMDRVRIPLSYLKRAGIDGRRVVLSTEVNGSFDTGVVVAQRDRMSVAKSLLEWAAKWPDAARHLEQALSLPPSCSRNETKVPKAELVVPSHEKPTVVRVLGRPYRMYGNWVSREFNGMSMILPASGGKVFYLIPVMRKSGGDWRSGWLLAMGALVAEMGRIIEKKQADGTGSHEFSIILWYSPSSASWFNVFSDPKDPLPEKQVEQARKACSDFPGFMTRVFGKVKVPKDSYQLDPPQVISTSNFLLELPSQARPNRSLIRFTQQ